jgi:hypothetical protein
MFVCHEQLITAQIQQVAASNAIHSLEERVSRWLLHTRDLLQSDTLPLSQDFLAQMLGVQRTSVTIVARKLQDAGLITYRRGHIQILKLEGLEDSCCECYGAINDHFDRLVGWAPDANKRDEGHQQHWRKAARNHPELGLAPNERIGLLRRALGLETLTPNRAEATMPS